METPSGVHRAKPKCTSMTNTTPALMEQITISIRQSENHIICYQLINNKKFVKSYAHK